MLITDNQILIQAAEKNYHRFKVPTCFVEAKKIVHHYTSTDKASLDIKTSVNKIGEIVNTSQYLNSIMWENISKQLSEGVDADTAFKSQREIYKDICILACGSGVEIDSAKRIFEVNIGKNLERLKNKYSIHTEVDGKQKLTKPLFFRNITLGNGYSINPNQYYRMFETPMDYLQRAIDKFRAERIKTDKLSFCEIIKPTKIDWNNVNARHRNKVNSVIEDIKAMRYKIQSLYIDYSSKSKEERAVIYAEVNEIRQRQVDYLKAKSFSDVELYLLLREIDKDRNVGYARTIFDTLFATANKSLYDMIRIESGEMYKLSKKGGENRIQLFEYDYFKQKIG